MEDTIMTDCITEITSEIHPESKIGDIVYDNGTIMVYDGQNLFPTLTGCVKMIHIIPSAVTKYIRHPTEFYFDCITKGIHGQKITEIQLHHETHRALIERAGFIVNPRYTYAVNYESMEIFCNYISRTFKFGYDYPDYDKELHTLFMSEHIKTSEDLYYSISRRGEALNILFRCDDVPFREYQEVSIDDLIAFHEAIKKSSPQYSKDIDNLLQTIKMMNFSCIGVYSTYNFFENYACCGENIRVEDFCDLF